MFQKDTRDCKTLLQRNYWSYMHWFKLKQPPMKMPAQMQAKHQEFVAWEQSPLARNISNTVRIMKLVLNEIWTHTFFLILNVYYLYHRWYDTHDSTVIVRFASIHRIVNCIYRCDNLLWVYCITWNRWKTTRRNHTVWGLVILREIGRASCRERV